MIRTKDLELFTYRWLPDNNDFEKEYKAEVIERLRAYDNICRRLSTEVDK